MIYTFYSYKGGVGRTMALANVAASFYRQGLRVVMVDWDLEAPGLENFFFQEPDDLERVHSQLGVIDLMLSYKRLYPSLAIQTAAGNISSPTPDRVDERELSVALEQGLPPVTSLLYPIELAAPPGAGTLSLLTSGWRAGERFPAYSQAVQTFDWSQLYNEFQGAVFFDYLRRQLQQDADVILIDSRTGVTEMGGVCTRQLADVVVSFCAPNIQNLFGVVKMVKSFTRTEVLEARGHRPLDVVVVPARLDNAETVLRNHFKDTFHKELADYDAQAFWALRIPYVAQYAYAEKLALARPDSSEDLEKAYYKLTAYLGLLAPELRQRFGSEWMSQFGGVLPRKPFTAPSLPAQYVVQSQFEQARSHLLTQASGTGANRSLVITGPGGSGKTTLAAALCRDKEVTRSFRDGVLWVQERDARRAAAVLYEQLTGNAAAADPLPVLMAALAGKQCLLVLDDVREFQGIESLLQLPGQSLWILTTRNLEVARRVPGLTLSLGELTPEEAVKLIGGGLPVTPKESSLLHVLVNRLHRSPLALSLGAGALRGLLAQGTPLPSAVQHLTEALDRKGLEGLARGESRAGNLPPLRELVETSMSSLAVEDRERFIALTVFPGAVDIPMRMLTRLWGTDDFEARQTVHRLRTASLAWSDVDGSALRIHPLIRDFLVTTGGDSPELHRRLAEPWGNGDDYLWRWGLYHLARAGQREEVRNRLLDVDWLLAKLKATNAAALAADCQLLPEHPELQHLAEALQLSADALDGEPDQLAGQLLGRLAARAEPALQALLEQAARWRARPWLRPITASLIAPGGALYQTLRGHADDVTAVAVLPDGNRALSGSSDGTLKLWDLSSGTELMSLAGSAGPITDVAITPDGQWGISGSASGTLKCWDLQGGREEFSLKGSSVQITAVTASSQLAIVGALDGTVRVWDLHSRSERFILRAHARPVTDVALTPDGRQFLSVSFDGTVRQWNLENGNRLRTLSARKVTRAGIWLHLVASEFHPDVAWSTEHTSVAVTPDMRQVLTASNNGSLRLWDLDTGAEMHVYRGHSASVTAVAVLPDGRRFVSASADDTIKVWRVDDGQQLGTLHGHTQRVRRLAVTPDGRRIVSGSDDKTLKVWDLERMRPDEVRLHHTGRITALAVTAGGRGLVSASDDGSVRVWEPERGMEQVLAWEHSRPVTALALTSDGRVLSGTDQGELRAWNLSARSELFKERIHQHPVAALAVLPDAKYVLSAAADEPVKLVSLESGTMISPRPGTVVREFDIPSRVRALVPMPDGRGFLAGAGQGAIVAHELEAGRALFELRGHSRSITALAVSANGSRLVSASEDFTLKLWDLASLRVLATLQGHGQPVTGVSLTPDGRYAVSSSLDRTVKVWDLQRGELLATFSGDSPMSAVSVDLQGAFFCGGEDSGSIHVLSLALAPAPLVVEDRSLVETTSSGNLPSAPA